MTNPTTFNRSSGVLLHISSLPGPFGMGTFGKEARQFVDFLADMGMSWWQTLPFGPIDAFNSPYKSLSAFAGNIYFIDPQGLAEEGLLTPEEVNAAKSTASPYAADFAGVRATRLALLAKAFSRITPAIQAEIDGFALDNAHWLPDYALCQAIQEEQGGKPWPQWTDKALRRRDPQALEAAEERLATPVAFHIFLQYTFLKQWLAIKDYANQKGIGIIGDMPIYVDVESADVWVAPQYFTIDEAGKPTMVAGVPPDYFSADGQLWGNPLYDWAALKKDHYAWWVDRLDHTLKLYDTVRIDHFRAFSAYWAVAGDAKTARDGAWLPGPGMDLFDVFSDTFDFSQPRIIAEDLGVVDQGVISLLADTGYPGMGVLQFGFIEDGDNNHLPHNYSKKTVAYTGTHDNNTLLGWLWELTPHQRDYALAYTDYKGTGDDWQCGGPTSPSIRAFIRALWQSSASIAMVPIQDLCGFGGDTKMNKPGQADGNWAFRITPDALDQVDKKWMRALNDLYHR